jgi:ribosome-associated protein
MRRPFATTYTRLSQVFAVLTMSKAADFQLSGEYITLDALLKATGMATSGGEAKAMVAAGKVQVDGQLELRKRCKIRVGQVVSLGESSIRVIERA